jgi:hypothetical protein
MYFRLEYTIREFSLPSGETLLFEVQDVHSVQVQIRAPNEQEQELGHKTQHAFCTAHVELDVSAKNQEVFERIEKNEIIEDVAEWRQKYKDQNGKEIILPSIEEFPEHYKAFLGQVNRELSDSSRLVINAMRWRTNTLGPHNAISTRGLSWSRDKYFWHPAPSSFSIRILDTSSTVRISEEAKEDIKNIIKEKQQEPVHHELFREAWGQRNGNPRSSLVTGLSALEVAIKVTIGSLIPGTSWLVENLPSPPVTRLLSEYLPNLPAVNTINGKVLPPPKPIIELIKKAVNIRNQIAHIGGKSPNDQTLDQILEAIRDVIWLLDYYCGHAWAYSHISKETKLALEN